MLDKTDKLKGIKTGDQALARTLIRSTKIPPDFHVVYSGLDTVDVAYQWGITTYLDGMFTCTPHLSGELDKNLTIGDYIKAGEYLDRILNLRNDMAKIGIFNSYKHAMNILGYEGFHAPDYCFKNNDDDYQYTRSIMIKHGEIDG